MMLVRCQKAWRNFLGKGALGREGFSLVEILMVMLILSVGILPIAMIQHRARQEVTHSDVYMRAVTVGQAQLERLKRQGFGNIVAEAGNEGVLNWNSTINNVAFGLDRVEVTVAWQDGGAPMTLTFADLVSMR